MPTAALMSACWTMCGRKHFEKDMPRVAQTLRQGDGSGGVGDPAVKCQLPPCLICNNKHV